MSRSGQAYREAHPVAAHPGERAWYDHMARMVGRAPTAVIHYHDGGGSGTSEPLPVAEAAARAAADRKMYPRARVDLAFSDCPRCGGEGYDEGRRCPACAERDDELREEAEA